MKNRLINKNIKLTPGGLHPPLTRSWLLHFVSTTEGFEAGGKLGWQNYELLKAGKPYFISK